MDDSRTAVATLSGTVGQRTRSPHARRTFRNWLIVAVLFIIGGSAGRYAYSFYQKKEKSEADHAAHDSGESSRTDRSLPVEVTHPRAGGVERMTTQAGTVHSFEHAALYAKVSGYLKIQNVDIGDRVKRDQLLAVIDDPEVDKAVDQNKASLDQATAKVKVAQAKVRSALAAKEAAEAMVRQAETMVGAKLSNQQLQDKTLKRVTSLVARNAVDQKLLDEQQDRYDVSVADVGVARAEVISAQAEVLNRAAKVEEAQADEIEAEANVEVATANLGRAKVFQSYTEIRSPYDGVVTLRSYHRGDFIRSASEGGNLPVLAVAVTDKMRVVLPIPDIDVPFVDEGDKAVLQIVALPGRKFTGTISRFSNSEDPSSRNMRTEIDLQNPDGQLHEGMYGRITVILQEPAPHSVTIPSSGLLGQTGTGSGSVYVVRAGKAKKVDVHVGNDNGIETEVLTGLTVEDQVITSYNGSLSDGTPVKAELKKAVQSAH